MKNTMRLNITQEILNNWNALRNRYWAELFEAVVGSENVVTFVPAWICIDHVKYEFPPMFKEWAGLRYMQRPPMEFTIKRAY